MSTSVQFDNCFDENKTALSEQISSKVYEEVRNLRKNNISFPKRIQCMTEKEIADGEKVGAGHGLYNPRKKTIKINKTMSPLAIALNFIHENIHHVIPSVSEKAVDILTHFVGCRVGINQGPICDFFEVVK